MREVILLLLAAGAWAAEIRIERTEVPLADGGTSPRLTLRSDKLAIAVLPELGGKICSLTDAKGREQLSRSGKAYRARTATMVYGDSEFDGIDECFPTVGGCTYPVAPWKDVVIPDHGELWNQAWKQIESTDGSLVLEARGVLFPYRFRRGIAVDGETVTLDYTVTNAGDAPLSYLYAFHPLLDAVTGDGLVWRDDQPVTVAYSWKQWLGNKGLGDSRTTTWSALTGGGKPFPPQQFIRDSGRYYKYIATPLTSGAADVHRADGTSLALRWDLAALPHLAVWCSEGGGVPGLNHLAPEPTTAPFDTLAQAHDAGQARILPPHGSASWRIALTLRTAP